MIARTSMSPSAGLTALSRSTRFYTQCWYAARIHPDDLKVQNSAILEVMVPLLEATARNNEDMHVQRLLLANVRQAYRTQVLRSSLNRMITGTGSTESAYYLSLIHI